MPRTVRINGDLEWRVERDPDDGSFVGVCETLNLIAIGDTWEELQACAGDAVQGLFEILHEDGQLDGFLREHGLTLEGEYPAPDERPTFDVPVDIIHERTWRSALAFA